MKKLIPLLAIGILMTSPTAFALSASDAKECQALAKSFGPAKTDVEAKMAERDKLAAEAEALGEAWQNAQNVRTLGEDAAAQADAFKARYEAKKDDFRAVEAELFQRSQKLNTNFARYNSLCVDE